MKFTVTTKESVLGLGRILGYRLLGNKNDEYNFVRGIEGNDYPRYHAYVKDAAGYLMFNIHLDQKRPVYAGHTAHSGEYDGELIEREAERIKGLLGGA